MKSAADKMPFSLQAAGLALLSMAPLHGCYLLAERKPLLVAGQITNLGLINFLAIALFSSLFAVWLIRQRDFWREKFLLVPGVLFLAAVSLHTAAIDKYYLIFVENSLLFTLLMWVAAWKFRRGYSAVWLERWAYPVYCFSWAVAVVLPFFILPAERIWDSRVADLPRYRSWFEEPSVLAFLSFVTLIWSFYEVDAHRSQGWKRVAPALLCLLAALWTIYQTAHRTSFLGIMFFAIMGILVSIYRVRDAFRVYSFLLLFALAVGLQFVGKTAKKNSFCLNCEAVPAAGTAVSSPIRVLPSLSLGMSGRKLLYRQLLKESVTDFWFGKGSGAASRAVVASPVHSLSFGSEPHSDILRVYFDHGLFGFTTFLLLWVGVAVRAGPWPVLPALAGLLGIFFFENPLVHPIWFMIPYFLALLSLRPRNA